MNPTLTEGWGILYLQLVITFYIFLFGLPALNSHMISEDIRYIIIKKGRFQLGLFIYVMILLSFSLGFIWIYHLSITQKTLLLSPLLINIIISIILVSFVVIWWYSSRKISRINIVEDLKKQVINQYRSEHIINKEKLDDLIYLGEKGLSGNEKKLVLYAISVIMAQVQKSEDYQGIELKRLIRGLTKILLATDNFGDDLNFYQTSKILKAVWNRLAQKDCLQSSDALLLKNTLEQIGIAVAKSKPESIVLAYLDAANAIPSVLFAIGVIALDKQRSIIATAALNKLEALAEQSGDINGEKLDDLYLLGLMAHFWQLGESAQQRIKQTLARLKGICRNSLRQTMLHAAQNHYSMTNYVTADKLNSLAKDITNKKPGNVRRTAAGSS